MSLIQDALKRQRNESGDDNNDGREQSQPASAPEITQKDQIKTDKEDASAAPQPGSAPVPAPEKATPDEQVHAPEEKPGRKVWLTIAGIIVFILVIIIAVIYLVSVTFSWIGKKRVQKVSPAPTEEVQPAERLPSDQDVLPERRPSLRAVGPSGPEAGLASVPSQDAEEEPSEPDLPSVQPPKSTPVSDSAPALRPKMVLEERAVSKPSAEPVQTASTSARIASEPPVVEPTPPMEWPRFELTGVLSGLGPGKNAAIINNQMIIEGSQIEGVTVLEVQADGVLLKYGNETRFLRMGASLY